MTTAETILEQLSLKGVGLDEFVTIHNPASLGNRPPVAFGGCAIGGAINAAFATVDPQYHLYSVHGNFLRGTSPQVPLYFSVQRIRDTRTFSTRRVIAKQELENDKLSDVALFTVDFHVQEESTLTFSAKPKAPLGPYTPLEACPTNLGNLDEKLKDGMITKHWAAAYKQANNMLYTFFDERDVPDGIFSQNMRSFANNVKTTTQDRLPLADRTSADYFKSKVSLSTPAEHASALSFNMDAGLGFLALVHAGLNFADTEATGTLEFALRIFVTDLDLNKWHLREFNAVTAGEGRAYAESRAWDEKGRLVCSMTQQTILRMRKKKKREKGEKAAL